MSPQAGMLLLNHIMPVITATVPRVVRAVGAEDAEELVQDTIAAAAAAVDSCERRGRPLIANSIAYYAIQHAKSGRRSYGATRTDALCPAARLDEAVRVDSLESPAEEGEDCLAPLNNLLAAPQEDPAQEAARHLDWAELLEDFNDRDIAVLECTVEGGSMGALAARFGVSGARLSQLKRELGRQVKLRWGEDVLDDVLRGPAWNGTVHAVRERHACRYERSLREQSAPGGRR